MSSSSETPLYDVIIVGAGVSGLTAAYEIYKHQKNNSSSSPPLKVKILEANPTRVGGRNFVDAEGTDLGSGYVGPWNYRLRSLIDDLDLQTYKVYTKGKTIQFIRGVPTPFEGTIPPVSVLGLLDVNNAMALIDRIANSVNPDAPHLTPNAHELDRITVAEYMRQHCCTQDAMNLMRTAIRAVCCVEPCEISVLGFAWYVRMQGNLKFAVETENGAQDSKVVGGTGRVSLELAKRLPEDWIQLNSPVREIRHNLNNDDDVVEIIVGNKNSSSYRTKTLILAIPPIQQFRIDFSPPLQPCHRQALQHFPMGHIIKTFTFYEKPFWRDLNLNGSIVCDEGIGLVCIDDTKPDGSMPCIMGFVLSEDAAIWGQNGKTPQDRRDALCKHYAKAFGSDLALRPTNYKEKIWADEPFVGGCYVGVPTPGTLTKFPNQVNRRSFLKLHNDDDGANKNEDASIFIAGTESAAEFVGYLEGAIEAGQRSARNALVKLGALGPKEKYFDIVTKPQPSKQHPHVEMDMSWEEKNLIPNVRQFLIISAGILSAVVAIGVTLFNKNKK